MQSLRAVALCSCYVQSRVRTARFALAYSLGQIASFVQQAVIKFGLVCSRVGGCRCHLPTRLIVLLAHARRVHRVPQCSNADLGADGVLPLGRRRDRALRSL